MNDEIKGFGKVEIAVETKKVPYNKMGCGICGGWKPLISVGFESEETHYCEECFRKEFYEQRRHKR